MSLTNALSFDTVVSLDRKLDRFKQLNNHATYPTENTDEECLGFSF